MFTTLANLGLPDPLETLKAVKAETSSIRAEAEESKENTDTVTKKNTSQVFEKTVAEKKNIDPQTQIPKNTFHPQDELRGGKIYTLGTSVLNKTKPPSSSKATLPSALASQLDQCSTRLGATFRFQKFMEKHNPTTESLNLSNMYLNKLKTLPSENRTKELSPLQTATYSKALQELMNSSDDPEEITQFHKDFLKFNNILPESALGKTLTAAYSEKLKDLSERP